MYESLVLKFGKSTSQNYPYAVEVASEFNTYRESGEGRSITHTVAFTSDQINDFFDLYDLVGRWKSCRIYIDGEFVPPNRRGFLWCFRERVKAYDQKNYCFGGENGISCNNFGCIYSRIEIHGWNGLKDYGSMDPTGIFHVNKDKLRHDVYKNIEEFKFCPALNLATVEKGINEIPDNINPKRNRDWEYVVEYDDNGNDIATAVRKKDRKNGLKLSQNEIKIDLSKTASMKQPTGCLFLIGLPAIICIIYSIFS